MAWLSNFLLGRPGIEYSFDVNPEAMQITESGVIIRQRNLAGDLKKAVLKVSAPIIKINSKYMTLTQRNQFNSLVGISDSLLSFQTRNDWQVVDELVTNLTSTTVQLSNSSATRLSAVLAAGGYASIITILKPWKLGTSAGQLYGSGNYGSGGYGSAQESFDPGTVTYNDATRVITFTNPLGDLTQPVLVSYTYTGWLVDIQAFGHSVEGGRVDLFRYDFSLVGA